MSGREIDDHVTQRHRPNALSRTIRFGLFWLVSTSPFAHWTTLPCGFQGATSRWNHRWLPAWRRPRYDLQSGDGWIESMFEDCGPAIDVEETDDEVIVEAEMPGLDKDDFKIEIADDRLILRGQKKKFENEERAGRIEVHTTQ